MELVRSILDIPDRLLADAPWSVLVVLFVTMLVFVWGAFRRRRDY